VETIEKFYEKHKGFFIFLISILERRAVRLKGRGYVRITLLNISRMPLQDPVLLKECRKNYRQRPDVKLKCSFNLKAYDNHTTM
jgi:hypothetical protein